MREHDLVILRDPRHLDGLCVVADHPSDEMDVRRRVVLGGLGGLCGGYPGYWSRERQDEGNSCGHFA
ncbi:MAG: hypothetical protein AUH41_00505 [Gemmatimonadetes bacterium 13_1_40CM_66_11]|nr:MAG: hypothetical protein AUH41_00505 [Gemmatimonadetes bacterium 13_1_40CM_66_11]